MGSGRSSFSTSLRDCLTGQVCSLKQEKLWSQKHGSILPCNCAYKQSLPASSSYTKTADCSYGEISFLSFFFSPFFQLLCGPFDQDAYQAMVAVDTKRIKHDPLMRHIHALIPNWRKPSKEGFVNRDKCAKARKSSLLETLTKRKTNFKHRQFY